MSDLATLVTDPPLEQQAIKAKCSRRKGSRLLTHFPDPLRREQAEWGFCLTQQDQ
jgi:hypothetical protein